MKKTIPTLIFAAMLIGYLFAPLARAKSDDQAEIQALEDRFIAALRAKDLDGIMSAYLPDESLIVFDVIPPREYVGAKAYREDWKGFLGSFKGPIDVKISDLKIETDGGDIAFSHSIQEIAGTGANGNKTDITVRATDCYRKTHGKWLIVHEHLSVPVDLETGRADLTSKP